MRCLALVLAALALAGCALEASAPAGPQGAATSGIPLQGDPEAPVAPTSADRADRLPAKVADVVPIHVIVAEGVALRGHVYLPDQPPPYATILGFGPYWGSEFPATDEMREGDALRAIYSDETYSELLRAGFAVALVNVRGTGASEGCYRFFDPQDGSDAAALIETLAAQAWSSGAVGMYGVSYDGWTQYAAMAERPPHLRATAPVSGILDLWSVQTRHGAPVRNYAGAGTLYSWTVGGAAHSCPEGARGTLAVDAAALDGDKTPAFVERDLRARVAASGIPAFATYGLRLPELDAQGRATPSEGLVMNAENVSDFLPQGSRVVVGPWPHGPPGYDSFTSDVVSWMDATLRTGAAPEGGARYQDATGSWRASQRWPPATRALEIELEGGQIIPSTQRPPSLETCGTDQAVYSWPALDAEAVLAGSLQLGMPVTSTSPDGNFAAWLFAFEGSDPCAADGARLIAQAHTDLRHRGHLEQGSAFPVGVAERIEVRSAPFVATVPAGSRLALVVAGGDALTLLPKAHAPILNLGEGTLVLPLLEGTGGTATT